MGKAVWPQDSAAAIWAEEVGTHHSSPGRKRSCMVVQAASTCASVTVLVSSEGSSQTVKP